LALVDKEDISVVKDEKAQMPRGTNIGYTHYTGISGKVYRVPVIADGHGGEVRWMADVPWVELPLEERLGFAIRGGGLLGVEDMRELWLQFGEWKKAGEYYPLVIGEPKE
jgi:hypothetical protein